MVIVFFSNYLNHHQIPFAEAMNAINGVEYYFVAVSGVPEFRKELGYQEYKRPYLLSLKDNEENKKKAERLSVEADVAIFVACNMEEFIIPRLQTGKLTFECSERWFKRRYMLNLFSPRLWRHQWMYYRYGRNSNLYMLCASAFAANDYYLLKSYRGKCFKWAYFTDVPEIDIEEILIDKREKKNQIMWCSRFVDWKHPELAINVARRLRDGGFSFDLNMYGNGPLVPNIIALIDKYELSSFVHLKGNAPNEDIIRSMRENHIFILTSDQNEGWGAVANEAMSNGCAIVGSHTAGAIPFLVKDGINGLVFRSNSCEALYERLSLLLNNPELRERLALNAYTDMVNMWSPKVAANRFLSLVSRFSVGLDTPFSDGPCSRAIPIN